MECVSFSVVVGKKVSILIERGHFDREEWTVDGAGVIRHRLWPNDGMGVIWSSLCEDPSGVAFQQLNLMEGSVTRSGIIVASPNLTMRSKFITEYSRPVVRGFWPIKPMIPDWDAVWASVHQEHVQKAW